jgi:hypothetical protein
MSRAASASTTSALTPSARNDCWDKFYSFCGVRDRPTRSHRRRNEKRDLTGRPVAVRALTVAEAARRGAGA